MLMSSTHLQNRSFHVVERTRTSAKCQKMKNARAKRAKILFLIVKYANLWGFCCRRRLGCLSSVLFHICMAIKRWRWTIRTSVCCYKASTGIVEEATASVGVERIQGRKKLEYKQLYAEATYSIETVTISPWLLRFLWTARKRFWCDWHLIFCFVSVRLRLEIW